MLFQNNKYLTHSIHQETIPAPIFCSYSCRTRYLMPQFEALNRSRCHFRSRAAPTAKKFARFGGFKFKVTAVFWRSPFWVCRQVSVSHYAFMSRSTRRKSSFPRMFGNGRFFWSVMLNYDDCGTEGNWGTCYKVWMVCRLHSSMRKKIRLEVRCYVRTAAKTIISISFFTKSEKLFPRVRHLDTRSFSQKTILTQLCNKI